MAMLVTVDIDLYKASVGPAWQNLQANYITTAEASGLMPKLIEFFQSRTEVIKQFGGQTINTVLQRQAAYWEVRPTDPKYPVALGFRQQYGYWPNLFEADAAKSWFVGGTAPLPDGEKEPPFDFQFILDWVKQNPLLATGIGLGGFLILTRRLRL